MMVINVYGVRSVKMSRYDVFTWISLTIIINLKRRIKDEDDEGAI
jgi:hypothetical protein